jgi:acetone carboxylase gamma subunit
MEYYCPGCATLLDVEVHCPTLEDKKMAPIWDTQLSEQTLKRAAKKKIQPWALAAE